MHTKKPYWFDLTMFKKMIEQANIGGYKATIGRTRYMKQRDHMLFKTSMMQDGWEYFPVRLEIDGVPFFKYVCENDFDRLCREYEMYSSGALIIGEGDEISLILCPQIKRVKN